jgi:hypothetical protein
MLAGRFPRHGTDFELLVREALDDLPGFLRKELEVANVAWSSRFATS